MKQNKKYTIGELAEATGISRRSVRFYVQTGVIPPPVGRGRFCYYTDEHLASIRVHRHHDKEALRVPLTFNDIINDTESTYQTWKVTRLKLGEGVVLELPEGCSLPDREQTMVLKGIIKQLLKSGSDNENK